MRVALPTLAIGAMRSAFPSRTTDALMVADYTQAASALFANVRLPASILAGALVPLGFGFLLPIEGPAYSSSTRKRLIRLHRLVAVLSYASLLVCIVYSSISINSLAEVPHGSATSVVTLIRQEYNLPWIATNATFMFGLCGALFLVAVRALLTWELDEGRIAAGVCGAALLLMVSVIDEQVKLGGYATDVAALAGTFFRMMAEQAIDTRSPWLGSALVVGVGAAAAATELVFRSTVDEPNLQINLQMEDGRDTPLDEGRPNARTLSTSQIDAVSGSVANTGTMGLATSDGASAGGSSITTPADMGQEVAAGPGEVASSAGETVATDAPVDTGSGAADAGA